MWMPGRAHVEEDPCGEIGEHARPAAVTPTVPAGGAWSGLVGLDDLPFSDRPFRLRMGLKPLDPWQWLEVDPGYDEEMALKHHLLAERHAEVFAALPGCEAASAEVLDAVVAHLLRVFPERFVAADGPGRIADRRSGQPLLPDGDDLHPLDAAGRLVQEDLCLHLPGDAGVPVLAAGSVCFPSRWSLREKLGLPIRAIHAPVAFYDEQLGAQVDQVIARLRPDRGVCRLNWNVHDDPALFQPGGHDRTAPNPAVTPDTAGDLLMLRVERQTLRRFSHHDSVLFTIRTHQRPLRSLEPRPDLAARLAAALRGLPERTFRYKSLPPIAGATLAYLDRVAAGGADPA